jgi:hypothetical protein
MTGECNVEDVNQGGSKLAIVSLIEADFTGN